ncbi:hypothetical protein GIB67_002072 [Kingdonia uniflora]|uniref:Uncharacterized protein n=1 Tax=Kingdonia uniflora TaxID=39325 RepID=A0A7J7KWD1_9MAGN|nr:hypothetical protein GIB67_002072 [Kingdonia uniflora]
MAFMHYQAVPYLFSRRMRLHLIRNWKELMKGVVMTSNCCFNSFCKKCLFLFRLNLCNFYCNSNSLYPRTFNSLPYNSGMHI